MVNELSIIIPALNEEKYLPKLLNSIVKQKFSTKLQVIVVDGQSTDSTIKKTERFKSSISDLLILKTKRGIGYQRNRGAEKAKYKYLLFIDADMILPANFLNRLLPKINQNEQFIETVLLWSSEFDILTNIILACFYPLILVIGLKEHYVPGGFILTTKENHKKLHGFREDVQRGEDTDYGVRSYQQGTKIHIHFFPFALHSARRIYKMGRIHFFLQHLLVYRYLKKYGINSVEERFPYPFGDY